MEIEELLGLLGLDLPRVLFVNMIAGLIKTELQTRGLWASVRDWGFLMPLAVGAGVCWFSGEQGMGAIWCGGLYGAAAIALHEFHTRL